MSPPTQPPNPPNASSSQIHLYQDALFPTVLERLRNRCDDGKDAAGSHESGGIWNEECWNLLQDPSFFVGATGASDLTQNTNDDDGRNSRHGEGDDRGDSSGSGEQHQQHRQHQQQQQQQQQNLVSNFWMEAQLVSCLRRLSFASSVDQTLRDTLPPSSLPSSSALSSRQASRVEFIRGALRRSGSTVCIDEHGTILQGIGDDNRDSRVGSDGCSVGAMEGNLDHAQEYRIVICSQNVHDSSNSSHLSDPSSSEQLLYLSDNQLETVVHLASLRLNHLIHSHHSHSNQRKGHAYNVTNATTAKHRVSPATGRRTRSADKENSANNCNATSNTSHASNAASSSSWLQYSTSLMSNIARGVNAVVDSALASYDGGVEGIPSSSNVDMMGKSTFVDRDYSNDVDDVYAAATHANGSSISEEDQDDALQSLKSLNQVRNRPGAGTAEDDVTGNFAERDFECSDTNVIDVLVSLDVISYCSNCILHFAKSNPSKGMDDTGTPNSDRNGIFCLHGDHPEEERMLFQINGDGPFSFRSFCHTAGVHLTRTANMTNCNQLFQEEDETIRTSVGQLLSDLTEPEVNLLVQTLVHSNHALVYDDGDGSSTLFLFARGVPASFRADSTSSTSSNANNITKADLALFQIHTTKQTILHRITALEQTADTAKRNALHAKRQNQPTTALVHLRRYKQLQEEIAKSSVIVGNLDAAELKLERMRGEGMIVKSYGLLREALREVKEVREKNAAVEDVAELMNDITNLWKEEVASGAATSTAMNGTNDVNDIDDTDILSEFSTLYDGTPDVDIDEEELEQELKLLQLECNTESNEDEFNSFDFSIGNGNANAVDHAQKLSKPTKPTQQEEKELVLPMIGAPKKEQRVALAE